METMKNYPLLIRFRDIIVGNGFVARVLVDGRALLTREDDDEHWVYGVQPGGVAGGESDAAGALNAFKMRYESVLFDIASEVATFEEFEREVMDFLRTIDTADAARWDEALEAVRQTNATLGDLPTVRAENVPPRVEVQRVDGGKAQPVLNELDCVVKAA